MIVLRHTAVSKEFTRGTVGKNTRASPSAQLNQYADNIYVLSDHTMVFSLVAQLRIAVSQCSRVLCCHSLCFISYPAPPPGPTRPPNDGNTGSWQAHEQIQHLRVVRCTHSSHGIPARYREEARSAATSVVAGRDIVEDAWMSIEGRVDEADGLFARSQALLIDAVQDRCEQSYRSPDEWWYLQSRWSWIPRFFRHW